jgi:hypothetical protein
MASLLKRVNAGWLARSVEDSKSTDASTRNWVVKVRNNWVDSDREESSEEEVDSSEAR